MDRLSNILYSNFFTLCLSLGLGIVILTNKSMDKKINTFFVWFILLVVALDIADMADAYLSSFSEVSFVRYITSAIGYTLRPAAVALILRVLMRKRKASLVLWLPIILIGVLSFTSSLTHLMFWFDAYNHFTRGVLNYLPYIVGGLYMLMLISVTIRMHRYISMGEVATVLYTSALSFLAVYLESISIGRFLLPGVMLISCTIYYLFLCTQSYKRDILTGLLNRRSFYTSAQIWSGHDIAVISVDLNGLKLINDTQGHNAGDKALIQLSTALQEQCGRAFLPYRTGGDEFMVLGRDKREQCALQLIETIRTAIEPYGLTAAFGVAMYHPGDNLSDVCNAADSHMYKDKSQYHHRMSERK